MTTPVPTTMVPEKTVARILRLLTIDPDMAREALIDETRTYLREHRAGYDGHVTKRDLLRQVRHQHSNYDHLSNRLVRRLGFRSRRSMRAHRLLRGYIAAQCADILQEATQ